MRREHRDELLRSCLRINGLLRDELSDVRKALKRDRQEKKNNPNWRLQPRAPQGTSEGGQWTDGGASPPAVRLTAISGDPMDGSDFATFGEMLLFEFTRGRYRRALARTQDPQQRIGIANIRATFARQAFGNFSGQEVEGIYTYEMRTRRDLIALGGTDLSERAMRLRPVGGPVGDGQNITVIEYRDANGDFHYIEAVSQPGRHAEELAVIELQRLRIPPANVTRIYTDRQPCSRRCRPLLRPYTRAYITWAVEWPDDEAGQTQANNTLARQIRSYRRMESQGTLPMQLWRYPSPNRNVRPSRRRRSRG